MFEVVLKYIVVICLHEKSMVCLIELNLIIQILKSTIMCCYSLIHSLSIWLKLHIHLLYKQWKLVEGIFCNINIVELKIIQIINCRNYNILQ